MAKTDRLPPEERELFSLVNRAVFTNPFSDERVEIDARLAGKPPGTKPLEDQALMAFMPEVAERLEGLKRRGRCRIDRYPGEDRSILEYAWLFYTYYRFAGSFDALIRTQLDRGDEPVEVPFSDEMLSSLEGTGIHRGRCLHYLALFFQLRRAYYFISKGLVGRSAPMKSLRRALWNSVFTHDLALYDRYLSNRMEDFSTLLLGETGTGKGAAAAAIGRCGYIPFDAKRGAFRESFTRTFLSINLSEYPESLIESELFGHCKGAFTGAVEHHDGIFSRSSPLGALFLDEIGEVSAPVQIKLLRVLQERTFFPVGSHAPQRFEGRVIAATNQPLERLRAEGRFREDFFYRLCSDLITVPPLRQRIAADPGELDDLIDLVVARTAGRHSRALTVRVRNALDRGLAPDYPWPGNVRELEQAVRRILLTGEYAGAALPLHGDPLAALHRGIDEGSLDAKDLLCGYLSQLYRRYGSYEEVARVAGLDRRTVKKHIARKGGGAP